MRYQKLISESATPLWSSRDDGDCVGDFSFDYTYSEESDDEIRLCIQSSIVSEHFKQCIRARKARLIMAISCPATYEYVEYPVGLDGVVNIPLRYSHFFGSVYLTMLAYSCVDVFEFPPEVLRGAYSNSSNVFAAEGTIIAVSNEETISLEPEPKPLDVSFFELQLSDSLPARVFDFDTSSQDNRVVIRAGNEIFNKIQNNRETNIGRSLNLSSVYFPVLVGLLYELHQDAGAYQNKLWFNGLIMSYPALEAKLLEQSDDFDPISIAQEIFNSPLFDVSGLLNEG